MAAFWDPAIIEAILRRIGVSTGIDHGASSGRTSFDTPLDPAQEQQFQGWRAQNVNPQDSGGDYDFRGAFLAGLFPGLNGHWADTFKKPNEPTFSDQSQYAKDEPALVGHWNGDTYVGPRSKGVSAERRRLQERMDSDAHDPLSAAIHRALSQIGRGRAV